MGSLAALRRLQQLLRPRRVAVLEACFIGLVSALAAGGMAWGVGWMGTWRVNLAEQWPDWLVLPLFGAIGALLSGALVLREAPEAAGSGMSQVKAVLARVPMPLNLRIALVKLISAVLALGSGLALGREGPTVQVGAALAAQLSHWLPTSPEHRRQLIAAGAGAGLAAAFNAPISGVLFVAEELMQDVSGGTLGTAILASFIGSSVSRLLGGNSLDVNLEASKMLTSFTLTEIPAYLVLGGLAGLLGAIFDHAVLISLKLNRRYLPLSLPWRMALAGLITGLLIALLPESFRNYAELKEALLSGQITWAGAALFFVSYFPLILIASGSGAPGGLLVPTLLLGAMLGCWLGGMQHSFLGLGVAVSYARVGMGAFMAATAKAPVTAIVIVFELTHDFNLVLPLMIASVIAYLVSERLFPGSFYDRILELNGIYLNELTTVNTSLADMTAAQVMQRQVETLRSDMPLEEAVQAFSRSHHRGFPVLEEDKLVGIVTQTDLNTIKQRPLPPNTPLQQIMTPWPITIPPQESLANVLYLLNRYNLSRLPVVEGRKLIGIITRSDIIRAEASELSGERQQLAPRVQPSYLVYQTRCTASGQGRLLLPLANPATADRLLQMGLAIARERQLELECLQVIVVPRHSDPSTTPVRTTLNRRLLQRMERLARPDSVPLHTQIRVAQDVAGAILETISDRHIDVVLMGWEGESLTPGSIFGSVVDTIVHQAECDVVLVKLAQENVRFDRWLVPIAGGPNVQRAMQLLPGLTRLSPAPQVRLCQVFDPEATLLDTQALEQGMALLKPHLNGALSSLSLRSKSIAEAIIELAHAEQDDVILVGASREGLLRQAIMGNIPSAITRNSHCSVILVRGALE
uniref:Chloride channel core n=1 Tax=Cyanothece sp. (strain PCC 7425 / ATCC 29141) TaxID=395961 RepID=B8HXI4_CYAP4